MRLRRAFGFVVWAGACGGADGGSTGAADPPGEVVPNSDSGAAASDPASDVFVDATGVIDGQDAVFACDDGSPDGTFWTTRTEVGDGGYTVGVACNASVGDTGYSLNIGVLAPGPVSGTICVPNELGVQVVDLGAGTFYNCALESNTRFTLDVDTWTVAPDGSTRWGGTFDLAGSGMFFDVDLTGAFLLVSPAGP